MKKISLITACATGLAMLFSCTDEKLEVAGKETLVPVTISASLGNATPAAKAVPTAPAGYQLRCIMVVDYKNEEDLRLEQVSTGSSFVFTFLPAEDEYTCLFWADFVEAGDAVDGKYADKYYDTGDLTAIRYMTTVLTDGSLYNNDACDAFCGKLMAGATNVVLKRPFAKLIFMNTGGEAIVNADKLAISYEAYDSFNIMDGTASGKATLVHSEGGAADSEGGIWFYNYLFAPKDQNRLPGEKITFQRNDEQFVRNIRTENIPLDANVRQNLTFRYTEQVDITVDIEDSFEERPARVGDYFYSDGTYGEEYENLEGKTVVGVVFAIAADYGDVPANYEGSAIAANEKVTAWVAATAMVTDNNSTPRFYDDGTNGASSRYTTLPENVGKGEDDILGYMNTRIWKSLELDNATFPAASYALGFGTVVAPENTSGWYLPSKKQMDVLLASYATYNGEYALSTVGTALWEIGQNAFLKNETGSTYNLWSSTANTTLSGGNVQIYRFDASANEKYGTSVATLGIGSGARVWPVLTF